MGFPYMSFPESTSLAETAFARITATEGAELSRGGGHRRSCRVPAHAGGRAGLPVPLPRVGPTCFSPIPPGHHAPTPLPVELPSRVVPKGTALAHEAPSAGGDTERSGSRAQGAPGPPAPNNGGAVSVPAPSCTMQPGSCVLVQPQGCPVTAGRCSAASSLPDVGCRPRSLHVMQAQKPHPPRAASCPRCLQQEPGRLHGDAEGWGSAKMQPGTGGGEVAPGQPGQSLR